MSGKKDLQDLLPRFDGEGLELIQSALSKAGAPVLGLYIFTASQHVLKTIKANRDYREIRAHLIGTPALLSVRPGITQTELARLLNCERATAGLQVEECIQRGWVRREASPTDRRSYALYLTPSGRRMLSRVVGIVDRHERALGASLSQAERETLRHLLSKLLT